MDLHIHTKLLILVTTLTGWTTATNLTESLAARDRRQVYHHFNPYPAAPGYAPTATIHGYHPTLVPYGVYPPQSPSIHLSPFSVFTAQDPYRPTHPSAHAHSVSKLNHGLTLKPVHKISSKSKHPASTVFLSTPAPHHPKPPHHHRLPPHHPPHHAAPYAPYVPAPYAPVRPQCSGVCLPLVACPASYEELSLQPYSTCQLYGGAPGVCCPPHPKKGYGVKLFEEPDIKAYIRPLSTEQLNSAARAGLWDLVERDILEKSLQERNIVVSNRRAAEYGHLQFFKTSPLAMKLGRDALTNAQTGNQLVRAFKLSPEQASYGLAQFSVKDTIISNTCPGNIKCGEKEKFYRTIDGSCNNLDNPAQGQARTPFKRILPPMYSDGLYRPRDGSNGNALPSARVVSISTVIDVDNAEKDFTLAVMQWGQFVDHDLTHTPIFRFGNESGIECCDDAGKFVDPSFRHPSCFPIEIPHDDPFFSKFRRRCMNFVRSMPAPRTACNFGYAEQMNQITHYLDGSNVYGSMTEEEEEIRSFKGGRLKVAKETNNLLPADRHAEDECDASDSGHECFLAGDSRVNEQPDLAVIHTVWMREHNRLADKLSYHNPHWSDETIYQEARRIVIAEYQHITYNEWLPIVLGKEYTSNNDLLARPQGFSDDYDDKLDATMFNEFATAAFRFGHTLVQGMIQMFDKKGRKSSLLRLHEHFNSPHLLYTPGNLDEFLRGLSTQPIQGYDNFVSEELTNRLFQHKDMPFGMDLVALNIQRGRDHAIPPYNDLREVCGLPRAKTFDDLLDTIPKEVVASFKLLYVSVDDIDAFIAGIAERPSPDSLVGPTFRCMVGDQFIRLKKGDRFYYEHGDMATSFTEAQLYEIRGVSWARILCDNGDHLKAMQPLAFRRPYGLNEKVSCESPAIPRLDLTPWISAPVKK